MSTARRRASWTMCLWWCTLAAQQALVKVVAATSDLPNVVLIVTDDQDVVLNGMVSFVEPTTLLHRTMINSMLIFIADERKKKHTHTRAHSKLDANGKDTEIAGQSRCIVHQCGKCVLMLNQMNAFDLMELYLKFRWHSVYIVADLLSIEGLNTQRPICP